VQKLTGFSGNVIGQKSSESSRAIFPINDWAAKIKLSGGEVHDFPSAFNDHPVGHAQVKSCVSDASNAPESQYVIGTGDRRQRWEHPPLSTPHTDWLSSVFVT
jgi:hypothetical protein